METNEIEQIIDRKIAEHYSSSLNKLDQSAHYYEYIELQNRIIYLNIKCELLSGVKGKLKIVYVVHIKSQFLLDLYKAFKSNDFFDIEIVTSPYYLSNGILLEEGAEQLEVLNKYLDDMGIKFRCAYNLEQGTYLFSLKDLKPDIIFFAIPYYNIVVNRPPFFHSPSDATHIGGGLREEFIGSQSIDFALPCYVPYAYSTVKEWFHDGVVQGLKLNTHFNLPLQNMVWIYFCESEWHLQRLREQQVLRGRNVVVTGYPKMDSYFDGHSIDESKIWKLGVGHKRVIYAPHHEVSDKNPFTFPHIKDKILSLAKKHADIEFVFKPHPLLKSRLYSKFPNQKGEIDKYFAEWNELPNGQIHVDGDYMDLFASSNAMISNSGSFVMEYLPSLNPYLDLRMHPMNEVGQIALNSYYQAKTLEDIDDFIENVILNQHDPKRTDREQALKEIGIKGGNSMRIVNYIKDQFK